MNSLYIRARKPNRREYERFFINTPDNIVEFTKQGVLILNHYPNSPIEVHPNDRQTIITALNLPDDYLD